MKNKSKIMSIIIGVSIIIFLTACGSNSSELLGNDEFKIRETEKSINDFPLVNSSNNFGLDIFKEEVKSKDNENIIISPISLFTAFNVLVNGANGETKEEIKSTLNMQQYSDEDINENMNKLINYLINGRNNNGYENTGFINIYNSIWMDNDFKVKDKFISTAKKYYDSDIFRANFSEKSTTNDMNKWIDEKSGGLIKNPIKENEINKDTLMSIFNVLHFKGKWTGTFNKENTKVEKFYFKEGSSRDVNMMNDERFISYYEDKDIQIASLSYYNGSMMILLPKNDINEFISKLDKEMIKDYSENSEYVRAKVKIPVLKVEYNSNLVKSLKQLGMKAPFEREKSDFSLLKKDEDPLWVSSVIQNSVVSVDEEGTEAAALTSVKLCGSAPPKEIKEFYVNKPFVFIIKENISDTILFVGKVGMP